MNKHTTIIVNMVPFDRFIFDIFDRLNVIVPSLWNIYTSRLIYVVSVPREMKFAQLKSVNIKETLIYFK